MKQREERKGPSPPRSEDQRESSRKNWAQDPWDVQRGQSGIETAQEGNQKAQEMKDRYVLLKHTVMQQRTRGFGEQQLTSKRLVLRVTQKEEP